VVVLVFLLGLKVGLGLWDGAQRKGKNIHLT
jgi:hypothetical protein